jgi:hypothetical protein
MDGEDRDDAEGEAHFDEAIIFGLYRHGAMMPILRMFRDNKLLL